MYRILITITCILFSMQLGAQKNNMTLSLDDVLRLSQAQSLQSFLIKNYYLSDYWQYRSFEANYLPSIDLKTKLFSYNNSSNLRYNSVTQSEEFVRTETLSSSATISMNQKVALTGGSFYVNSDLGRVENFGNNGYVQYSSTPIRFGYSQNLFGFNGLKWERKIEPLKFEMAKKEYIKSVENMNITAVNYFFQFAIAQKRLNMAEYNFHQTDTLVQVANKRFNIGSINKDELLDLKLNKNNTAIGLQEAKLNLRRAKDALLTFLMLPKGVELDILLPQTIPELQINAQSALQVAINNNPELLQNEIKVLSSKREVAKAKANNRFNANLGINLGMSKNDGSYDYINDVPENGTIPNVYKPKFDDYQVVNVNLNVPVLDWGKGKGQYQMAKSQQEIAMIAEQQAIQKFEQNTTTKVLEFNLQKEKVEAAALSDTLASESYDLTVTRFRRGNVDVLKLVSSQNAKDNAMVKYISALAEYWQRYYSIRELTLYDFENEAKLDASFEEILSKMK